MSGSFSVFRFQISVRLAVVAKPATKSADSSASVIKLGLIPNANRRILRILRETKNETDNETDNEDDNENENEDTKH